MKFRERMQLVVVAHTHDFSSLEAKIQSLFATGGDCGSWGGGVQWHSPSKPSGFL